MPVFDPGPRVSRVVLFPFRVRIRNFHSLLQIFLLTPDESTAFTGQAPSPPVDELYSTNSEDRSGLSATAVLNDDGEDRDRDGDGDDDNPLPAADEDTEVDVSTPRHQHKIKNRHRGHHRTDAGRRHKRTKHKHHRRKEPHRKLEEEDDAEIIDANAALEDLVEEAAPAVVRPSAFTALESRSTENSEGAASTTYSNSDDAPPGQEQVDDTVDPEQYDITSSTSHDDVGQGDHRKHHWHQRPAKSPRDFHAPFPLLPAPLVKQHLVASALQQQQRQKQKSDNTGVSKDEESASGVGEDSKDSSKKKTDKTDENSTTDNEQDDADDAEIATEQLTPLKPEKLWDLFKSCGWKKQGTDSEKEDYLEKKFQDFVATELKSAFSSPNSHQQLPRDLSTRSKRTVFVRVLHEQADLFCESLIEDDGEQSTDANSVEAKTKSQLPSPQYDRHQQRKPRFVTDKCIRDKKEDTKQQTMVCRNAFGEDLGKYVLANSQRTQDLKRKWKGKKLSEKDFTEVKSLASLPMFGSGSEEVFFTTPNESKRGLYCGMDKEQMLGKFYEGKGKESTSEDKKKGGEDEGSSFLEQGKDDGEKGKGSTLSLSNLKCYKLATLQ